KMELQAAAAARRGHAFWIIRRLWASALAAAGPSDTYLFSGVELVALRRVAPRAAAQRLPANRVARASRSAAARGGVVAARQPLPLNRSFGHSRGPVVVPRSPSPGQAKEFLVSTIRSHANSLD